jgi:hypothetical protein
MNMIQTALATLALITTTGSVIYAAHGYVEDRVGAVETQMTQFVARREYDDFQWAYLKSELRKLRDRYQQTQDPRDLRDYQELLDHFCRRFPEDRDCS